LILKLIVALTVGVIVNSIFIYLLVQDRKVVKDAAKLSIKTSELFLNALRNNKERRDKRLRETEIQ